MSDIGFLSFFMFSFHLSIFYFIFSIYFLFFKNTASKYLNYADVNERKKKIMPLRTVAPSLFSFFRYSYFYIFFFLLTFKSFNFTLFFKHLSFESFSFNVYFIIIVFFMVLSFFFENAFLGNKHIQPSIDFFTALWLFFIIAPLCVFSNTLLTFFFFLELGSLLTLYLMVSAKDFFGATSLKDSRSASYFNSVFFQFWASFFSSVLLIYSIINFFFLFGTTEWVFLNFFLEKAYNSGGLLVKSQLMLAIYLFIFALVVKLGVSPFIFFKLEIYRGLPFVVLFYYSIIYFFFFFTLIFIVFLYYFSSLVFFISVPVFFFLFFATVLFVINLFNLYLLKNFFALSSLVNSLIFFFLIFSYSL